MSNMMLSTFCFLLIDFSSQVIQSRQKVPESSTSLVAAHGFITTAALVTSLLKENVVWTHSTSKLLCPALIWCCIEFFSPVFLQSNENKHERVNFKKLSQCGCFMYCCCCTFIWTLLQLLVASTVSTSWSLLWFFSHQFCYRFCSFQLFMHKGSRFAATWGRFQS